MDSTAATSASQGVDSQPLTQQDIQSSLYQYQELLKAAGKYYRKILELSQTGQEFASTLEAMGKAKGAEQSGNATYCVCVWKQMAAFHVLTAPHVYFCFV
jgi:hypothetical protein